MPGSWHDFCSTGIHKKASVHSVSRSVCMRELERAVRVRQTSGESRPPVPRVQHLCMPSDASPVPPAQWGRASEPKRLQWGLATCHSLTLRHTHRFSQCPANTFTQLSIVDMQPLADTNSNVAFKCQYNKIFYSTRMSHNRIEVWQALALFYSAHAV